MNLREWQQNARPETDPPLFRSGTEIMLALAEEAGEVAREVALLERVGTKVFWEREPSVDRLAEEITQVLNLAAVLAGHYGIDLELVYENKRPGAVSGPGE